MKSVRFVFLLLLLLCTAAGSSISTPKQANPPNFIFILTDDQGWSSTSIGMDDRIPASKSDFFETPSMDRLAREGMRFTNAYAPAAICSPTRRSILFGQTPARLGDETFPDTHDPRSNLPLLTIPAVLKSIDPGYRAAHFGKWDLRANIFPEDLGFDESDGDTGNAHGNLLTGKDDKWEAVFLTNDPKRSASITRRGINFMERQVRAGNPFYLQLSHYAAHVDMQTREATLEKYRNKPKGTKHHHPAWAGMLEDMDATIGQVLDKVASLGISENTYILLMADNGSVEMLPPVPSRQKLQHPDSFDRPLRNAPLRAGKWTLYEGGIRVPFIVKGPGVPAGSTCRESVGGWDILPTLATLAGYRGQLPDNLDGGSFAGLLQSEGIGEVRRTNDFLVFHRYSDGYPHSALIQGDYKLIRFWKTGNLELYHLPTDLGETNDLNAAQPGKAEELDKKLHAYLQEVNPQLLKKLTAY
jgi:arylsulfatase A-like enzyme